MKHDDLPQGMHLSIPTREPNEAHEGPYCHDCTICQQTMRELIRTQVPMVNGKQIRWGDEILYRTGISGRETYAWGIVEEINVNLYSGEIWLHVFEQSNRILRTSVPGEITDVRPLAP